MAELARLLQALKGVRKTGTGWSARCPAHEDREPSLSIHAAKDGRILLYCHAGCSYGAVRAALGGVERTSIGSRELRSSPFAMGATHTDSAAFSAKAAANVWRGALARARDNKCAAQDRPVYDYLAGRALTDAIEQGECGVLGPGMPLPLSMTSWPRLGYRVVAPLYKPDGSVGALQSRCTEKRDPKTKFPAGARIKGTVFANHAGLQLLRGAWTGARCAVVAEGLTDFLALSTLQGVPVLGAPGTSFVVPGIGAWVNSLDLMLALDNDSAGYGVRKPAAQRAHELGAARVLCVRWPGACKDACEVLSKLGRDALVALFERQFKVTGDD